MAHRLAQDIRQSEEYQTYHGLKDEVMGDETTAALIKEYKKLQVKLQMGAVAGHQPESEDMQRFQGITSLLFTNPEVSRFMLAEMRLQQMLAVGRALMSRPKVLMMDEPSLGLAPLVVQGIFDIIREINKQGVTVLLIEQNANMALKVAHKAYVIETGTITMEGTGAELLANEEIKW